MAITGVPLFQSNNTGENPLMPRACSVFGCKDRPNLGAWYCPSHLLLIYHNVKRKEELMARAKTGGFMDGYVEVKDRIHPFHEKYPEGRIETEVIEITDTRVTMKALLYEKRDSEVPIATGHSWMNVPGTSNFTKGSEIENTETSAVGRALAFLGIGIDKSIASREEVEGKADDSPPATTNNPNAATTDQKTRIRTLAEKLWGGSWKEELHDVYGIPTSNDLDKQNADIIIAELEDQVRVST